VACTLEAEALPDRLAAWRHVAAAAVGRSTTPDGATRVELGPDVAVGELAELVAAEQRCCAFLSFTLAFGPEGTVLEVRAPADAAEVVEQLLGSAAG
jgi:MerR family transcriptional regulator, copper efflux regulator